MGNLKISVIIPTYNRKKQVSRAIDSVINQTYKNTEIIVCDDGSSDGSDAYIKRKYATRVVYLKIRHTALPGVARNAGMAIATGKYIAFLDSDDVWFPQKLELQMRKIEKDKLGGCASNALIVNSSGKYRQMLENMPRLMTFEELLKTNWIVCSSFIGEARLLKQLGGFPVEERYRAYEDWILWMRFSTITDICVVEDPLVKYIDNPEESIRSIQINWELIANELRANIIKWGLSNFINHPNKRKLIKCIFHTIYYLKKGKS